MKDLQIATGESCDTYWKIFRKVFVNIGMFRYDMTTKFNLRQVQRVFDWSYFVPYKQ